VGTGQPTSILQVAQLLGRALTSRVTPSVTGKFRAGDIRHCIADTAKIRARLGFAPRVRFEDGLADLVRWVEREEAVDRVDRATRELAARGLVR
jgi:dTDP-L-rhamnose 4-epimerase